MVLALSLVLGGFVAGERNGLVGDVQATIHSTLHGTEHTGTVLGGGKTDIKEALERTAIGILNILELVPRAIDLRSAFEHGVHVQSLQQAAGAQKASAVGSRVVLQTHLEAIAGELTGVSDGKDAVTIDLRVSNLADHVLVGETDDESVLVGLVLVLVLDHQLAALVVVGAALAAAPVEGLVPLEVGLVLNNLDERHFDLEEAAKQHTRKERKIKKKISK